jgi:hypothetical protein
MIVRSVVTTHVNGYCIVLEVLCFFILKYEVMHQYGYIKEMHMHMYAICDACVPSVLHTFLCSMNKMIAAAVIVLCDAKCVVTCILLHCCYVNRVRASY